MEENKIVSVKTINIRKAAEALLYLGSIGGKITDKCVAVKNMFLSIEVEVPWDVPVEKVVEGEIITVTRKKGSLPEGIAVEEKAAVEAPVTSQRGRKKKESVTSDEVDVVE